MTGMTYHHSDAEKRLRAVRGVIWDLDNTLYRLERVMEDAFSLGVARAVLAAGIDLPLKLAAEMAHDSFEKYGSSGRVFIDRYKLDAKQLHLAYHGYLDEKVIVRSQEVKNLFSQLPDLQHALVTHSSRDWAARVLGHLGLSEWFPPNRIFGLEDYDFQPKHKHSAGFDTALSALNFSADQVAVMEDTLPNLEIPHKMGLTTVYIRHARPLNTLPAFLQISCDSTVEILQALLPDKN